MRSPSSPDPFGTSALRAAVLDAWRASPARFREDANAEEELTRGAYRDRVIVELAQNAADAALQARVEGRLLVKLSSDLLEVANTGAHFDRAGVAALSSLRASAKRDSSTVGRFGVGFAAVLAVTDEPKIAGIDHGVRWSRSEAADMAGQLPELRAELAARGDAVPVLRLPIPADGGVPAGYDTCVSLPLRDQRASDLAESLVSALDDGLLLALPGLDEVVIEVAGERRTMTAERTPAAVRISTADRTTEWRLVSRSGTVPEDIRADRPIEEPASWSITVAAPVDAAGEPVPIPASVPSVIHAPTPTDDRTGLPALVLGTFPLDSSRRRIAAGPLVDLLAAEVATAYAALATTLVADGAGARVLDLVPGVLPDGEIDAVLQPWIVDALGDAALVPPARGASRLRPRDCILVTGLGSAAEPEALAAYLPGLPERSWWRPRQLRSLGARELALADVVDELSGVSLSPAGWRELYSALDGADLEALAAVPVPLSDGRHVRGARGAYLPTGEIAAGVLDRLGVRIVAPAASHPLLSRLGAVDGTPAALLADPQVRAAVVAGDEEVGEAVLDVVAASNVTVEDEPWLADVLVADGTGGLGPAGELWFPDTPLLVYLDLASEGDPAERILGADALQRWGRSTLTAVGVRDGFAVLRANDVALDDELRLYLDDEDGWAEAVLAELPDAELPPVLVEVRAIRDLELVRDEAWPDVLQQIATDSATRPAVVEDAVAVTADGARHRVTPYSAWWLRTHARIAGRPISAWCAADAEPIVQRVLDPIDAALDSEACRAIGLARRMGDLIADPRHLLDRLADSDVSVSAADLAEIYRMLEIADLDLDQIPAPELVRVPAAAGSVVVPAHDVVVADGPYWLQLGLAAVVAGSEQLADILDVDLASDVYDVSVPEDGELSEVPAAVRVVVAGTSETYVEHDELVIAGRPVEWWVFPDGTVHASTIDGLARGLAWAAGEWSRRFEMAAVLADAGFTDRILGERLFDRR